VISVLLLLVGFLAELIVTQGERITQLEKRWDDESGADSPPASAQTLLPDRQKHR
jgi:hypothetical protein